MNIEISLDKDFESKLEELKNKYGEEITKVNGFSKNQLDYTSFISNFIDSDNVANATIDPNANQSTKDVRSLLDEMSKSHQKLLSMNKIYYEMKKKYGKNEADKWLEDEFSGALYLHDASSSSFYSYCILPNECCTFIYNGRYVDCSMQDIYNIVDEREFYDTEAGVHYKIPKNLKVQDLDKNTGEIRYTKVSMVSKKNTNERFFFTKLYNGMNLITTENHQFIGETADTAAKDIVENETKAYSAFDNKKFTNSIEYYHGIPMNEDFGYLVGMYLAEGYNTRGHLSICQDFEKSKDTCARIIGILDKYNMPYKLYPNSNIIRLKNGENNWERRLLKVFRGKYCDEKRLCEDYIHFSDNFLIGFLAGIIDGDGEIACNRTLMIRMTSRTLINQIRSIGLHFGVYFGSRLPYIQSQEAKIQQKRPIYSANVNMNRNKDFFLSLPSLKISEKFTNYEYDESSANKNYACELGHMKVRDCKQTYKPTNTVYDLSTETHTFICNDILIHNCYAYELQNLAEKGLYFLPKSNTTPPHHLTTFMAHLREFIVWVSNRTSGACALPSFFIYTYYFWKKDVENGYFLKDPEYYRRQMFQQFIFEVNQIHTRITQSAYTNLIIMDRPYIEELFGTRQFPDGTFVMDYIDEIIEHEKVFMETEAKIREEVFHTFPVYTYAFLFQNGKFVDEEFARWCNRNNLKWYDSNFYIGDSVTNLASCCRMLNDLSKQKQFQSSIGGSLIEIGSTKVSTINLMRIAIESEGNKEKFIDILKDRVKLNMDMLDCVRHIIKRNIEKGLLPNYSYGVINLEKQTTTNGLTAMFEAVREMGMTQKDKFGNVSYTDEGIEFACKIMDTVNELQDNAGFEYNVSLEIVPAESANVKLCRKDNIIYGRDIDFIYSNQWTNLMEKTTMEQRIKLSSILDRKAGGGQILHINLDGGKMTEEQSWETLNKIANSGVIYFAFNPKLSICKHKHTFFGETCPICGEKKEDEVTRIVGYLVPTSSYSAQRKKEEENRQWYSVGDDLYL